MRALVRFLAAILWIPTYLILGAMMAVAAVPSVFLARWGWRIDTGAAWHDALAEAFLGIYFSILSFFLFGLVLMFVLPMFRFLLNARPSKTGSIPIHNTRILPWYIYNGMLFTFNTVYGRFARLTTIYPVYLRMMGAKIGKDVVFNTQHVYDLDILSVGDKTVIGANASILGHVGEKGRLVRMPVTIGKHCTVGQYANIFPGVTMGDNCHVGAMSMVPKGMQLDANAVYGGVPARKIKDLKPGQHATTEDVAGTVGTPNEGI
ncbi:MAG TPA: DapH/DapD/GlmU-related protein [Candidatus Thermoplasmatota archaeon]|nr:DapH/DapD/GlmU-related protein [Candidatus Thermoplasmatota archaeon]